MLSSPYGNSQQGTLGELGFETEFYLELLEKVQIDETAETSAEVVLSTSQTYT